MMIDFKSETTVYYYLVGKTTFGQFDTLSRVKTRGTRRQCQQVGVCLLKLDTM